MNGDGIDTEFALVCLAGAVMLALWAAVASYVRGRAYNERVIRRHVRRVIQKLGIEDMHPTVVVFAASRRAVVMWEDEEGTRHTIVLTWRHAHDRDTPGHAHIPPEETPRDD